MNRQTNRVSNNFGKLGWSMVFYSAFSYYISAPLSTDGLNFYPAQFEALHSWKASLITTLAGVSGWVTLFGAVIFAHLIAQTAAGVINIVTGILVLIFANVSSFPVFILMVFALNFIVGNVQLNLVPNNLMPVWFPKKKGVALGWATMGMPICTATVIPLLALLTAKLGSVSGAYTVFGVLVIMFGIENSGLDFSKPPIRA